MNIPWLYIIYTYLLQEIMEMEVSDSQEKMAAFLWGFPLPVQNTQNLVVNPHTRWHIKTVLSNTIGQYAWIQGHWKLCGDVF